MKNLQHNQFSNPQENSAPFLKRLYIYQKERFPVVGHGLLVASFSFSAISYSRICRGIEGFVSWDTYIVGILTTITLFFLLRVFDEFKDAEDDARYRQHLAVPRGLISFRELFLMGIVVTVFQIGINLYWFPKMLIFYGIVIAYLLLMGKEFFIAEWLKKHQFWYVTSHMFIIPLVDMYASGLDWFLAGAAAPTGLILFFAVSYMNGIVLEIGRKIRTPEKEAEGVLSYTSLLGTDKAVYVWLFVLFITLCLSIAAAYFAGYGLTAMLLLSTIFILCSIPAVLFLKKKTEMLSKRIEQASAVWTMSMYLALGGIPMLEKLLLD